MYNAVTKIIIVKDIKKFFFLNFFHDFLFFFIYVLFKTLTLESWIFLVFYFNLQCYTEYNK